MTYFTENQVYVGNVEGSAALRILSPESKEDLHK